MVLHTVDDKVNAAELLRVRFRFRRGCGGSQPPQRLAAAMGCDDRKEVRDHWSGAWLLLSGEVQHLTVAGPEAGAGDDQGVRPICQAIQRR